MPLFSWQPNKPAHRDRIWANKQATTGNRIEHLEQPCSMSPAESSGPRLETDEIQSEVLK